jgi:hypothetical protein
MLSSVCYLGHLIRAKGLHTAESKVKAVVDAPETKEPDRTKILPWHGQLLRQSLASFPGLPREREKAWYTLFAHARTLGMRMSQKIVGVYSNVIIQVSFL